ncbi:MAG: OmpA family protein [Pseudomonadota bacterium]
MIIKRFVLSFFVASLLVGCTTLDPYTREEKTSKATKGALIGAASGAVAGLLTGDDATERRQHALIGAGVGALAGAAVGNYMDRQEMKLRQQLENSGVSVQREGDEIRLIMPGHVTFQTNSADLYSGFFDVLDSVAIVLDEFDKTVVEVSGHTDSTGSESYNMQLSEKRANTVATYVNTRGVSEQRIVTLAYGEEKPIASNGSAGGRKQNRRVELRLVPLTA